MTGGRGQLDHLLRANPNAVVGAARDIYGGAPAAGRAYTDTQSATSNTQTWSGQSGSAFTQAVSDHGQASHRYAEDVHEATTAVKRYAGALHRAQQSAATGLPYVNRAEAMYGWARSNLTRPMTPANRQYVVDTYRTAYNQSAGAQRDLINPAITSVQVASADLRGTLATLPRGGSSRDQNSTLIAQRKPGRRPTAASKATEVRGIAVIKSQNRATGVWTATTPGGDVLWTATPQRSQDTSISRWLIRATPDGLEKMSQELDVNKDVWAQAKNSNNRFLLGALGIPAAGAGKVVVDDSIDKAGRTAKETRFEMNESREAVQTKLEAVERSVSQADKAERAAEADLKAAKAKPFLADPLRNHEKIAKNKLDAARAANEAAKLERSRFIVEADLRKFEIDTGLKNGKGKPPTIKGTGVKGGLNSLERAIEGGSSRIAPRSSAVSKGLGFGAATLGVLAGGIAGANQSIDDATTNSRTLQTQLQDSRKTIDDAQSKAKVQTADFSRNNPNNGTWSGATFAVDLPASGNPVESFRSPAVRVTGPIFHGSNDGSTSPTLVQPTRGGTIKTNHPLTLLDGYQPDLHPERKTTLPVPSAK
jgi:uncharacterized protein YukE